MVTSIPIVEGVLDEYAPALGPDFIGYRNHVHRVVNLYSDCGFTRPSVGLV